MRPVVVCPNCGHRILPNATVRQQKILDAIARFSKNFGCAPTMPELAHVTGLTPNIVLREVEQLVREGGLTKRLHGPRSIALTPEAAQQPSRGARQ